MRLLDTSKLLFSTSIRLAIIAKDEARWGRVSDTYPPSPHQQHTLEKLTPASMYPQKAFNIEILSHRFLNWGALCVQEAYRQSCSGVGRLSTQGCPLSLGQMPQNQSDRQLSFQPPFSRSARCIVRSAGSPSLRLGTSPVLARGFGTSSVDRIDHSQNSHATV